MLRRGFVDDERTAQMREDGWLNLSVVPQSRIVQDVAQDSRFHICVVQWQHNQFFDILVLEDVMGTMDALNIPTVFLQEFEQFFRCRFHHLHGIIIIHIDT